MSDELLERALTGYSAEPRAGLEGRVLHYVYARSRRRRLAAFLWVAAAAGLLLMVTRPNQTPPLPQNARVITAKAPAPEPATPRFVAARKRRPLAKQSVFPTPVPLTDGEKAFLSLMRQHPETSSQMASRQTADVLEIPPLQVQPLKTETVQ